MKRKKLSWEAWKKRESRRYASKLPEYYSRKSKEEKCLKNLH